MVMINNSHLGFRIFQTIGCEEQPRVLENFIDIGYGRGKENPFHIVLQLSSEGRKDKVAKVTTACNMWIHAINNHGGIGHWKIADLWDSKNIIRQFVKAEKVDGAGSMLREK